jgi:hypothetical protein
MHTIQRPHHHARAAALAAILVLVLAPSSAGAQTTSAKTIVVPGGEGSLGLDGTIDKFYKALHRAVVTTADGVQHIVHVNDETVVHGASDDDRFAALVPGAHVAVHYVVKGDRKEALEIDRAGSDGVTVIDGHVVGIDRARQRVYVALEDGKRVTLRLTDRAAKQADGTLDHRARVIVFYSEDGSGDLVAHYFRKMR